MEKLPEYHAAAALAVAAAAAVLPAVLPPLDLVERNSRPLTLKKELMGKVLQLLLLMLLLTLVLLNNPPLKQ